MFTKENSLKALEQFKTREELADLFLDLITNSFELAKEMNELKKENEMLKERLNKKS